MFKDFNLLAFKTTNICRFVVYRITTGMTDKFSIVPFKQLLKIVLNQFDTKRQFFGIPVEVFFTPKKYDPFRLNRFGQLLESPIGVAAGPHSQMAQNIVASWLCGARYIELKTIQTLDELEVTKPCIDMQDEGYNCEWSQELKITDSFDQYLNAWILVHILKHKFGWNAKETGVIFNMSVGYDMQGILKDNVQWFFQKMKNCSTEKDAKVKEIVEFYPAITEIEIPDCISNNITLSTMHGCPPEEIEKIGHYLIKEKKLHTTIKLNPTLLGKEKLHQILDNSGFKTQVPDEAFEHDLKYPDAIEIIQNLQKVAIKSNVHFGLKLTNTLESLNHKSIFTESQKMMYMSGRALHPLAINLAFQLQSEFNGELDISFSAGVNAFNIDKVISCGLTPATVCSDILKPGGYGLMLQYLKNIKSEFKKYNSNSIEEFILKTSGEKIKANAILTNLNKYSKQVISDNSYKKTTFQEPSIKTERPLSYFDCIQAPCVDTCPTHQDIPDYLHYVANKEINNSLQTILRTNPFPHSTGMVCDHLCQTKCTRINYDDPLLIRAIKRFVAEQDIHLDVSQNKLPFNGKKAAIIGAGPAGLSCGYYLALAGFEVTVYENKNQSGGMVSGAIPSFRLTNEDFQRDIDRILELGVNIIYNHNINSDRFADIKHDSDYVFIATGAPKTRRFNIEGINITGVFDPLELLFKTKENQSRKLGKNIVIIGGGNTAMDTARTVYRLADQETRISILYRRTMEQMPADMGEIKAVLEEGIKIQELVLPIRVNHKNGKVISLTCIRMKLDGLDVAGRPKPVAIENSEFEVECDTLIPAIGQDPQIDFIDPKLLTTKPGIYETKLPGVFIGGDALRGASTAINAIGDGRKIASLIMEKEGTHFQIDLPKQRNAANHRELMINRMKKIPAVQVNEISLDNRKSFEMVTQTLTDQVAQQEASRCLKCDELCSTCVTVCPNLALYAYEVDPFKYNLSKLVKTNGHFKIKDDLTFSIQQAPQILHIADWCNECGNCNTFCPTAEAPYKNKPHIYLNKEAFEKDDDCYFLEYKNGNPNLLYRKDGHLIKLEEYQTEFIFTFDKSVIKLSKKEFEIKDIKLTNTSEDISLIRAAEMRVILEGAKSLLNGQNSDPQFKSQFKNENNSPFSKGAGGIQKTPYLPYNKNLRKFSRNLRNDSTLGEVLLWKELRAKKLGYTFNRQKPILNYIVDFYCKPLNLVIEVDGSRHDNNDAIKRDTIRQDKLESLGLNFLRFEDREVKKNKENVIRVIIAKIKEIEKGGSS